MWGTLLTALATARATSSVKQLAANAGFMLAGASFIVIAVVFASIALYHTLAATNSPAAAAFIVAVILAAVGGAILYFAQARQDNPADANPMAAVSNMMSSENVEQAQRQVTRVVRQIGPIKISAAAFILGIIAARRF